MILGCTVLLFFILNFFAKRDEIDKYNNFNSATIKGKLTSVTLGKGASVIVVGNREFIFWPFNANNHIDFPYLAKKGDSVYKPAKSDTLKLFHNGKMYLYTFQKFK